MARFREDPAERPYAMTMRCVACDTSERVVVEKHERLADVVRRKGWRCSPPQGQHAHLCHDRARSLVDVR